MTSQLCEAQESYGISESKLIIFRKVSRNFRKVQEISEKFQEISEKFQGISEKFQEISEKFHEISGRFQEPYRKIFRTCKLCTPSKETFQK